MNIDQQLERVIDTLVGGDIELEVAIKHFRGKYIATALRVTGNVTRASRKLGVHRNTVHNDIRLGIVPGYTPKKVRA